MGTLLALVEQRHTAPVDQRDHVERSIRLEVLGMILSNAVALDDLEREADLLDAESDF